MAWNSDFETQLSSGHYHLKFRLRIGTLGINHRMGDSIGIMEVDDPRVLEITSHGDASGTVYGGAEYKHVQGLTGEIRFGAQSVTPRKWEYQLATMSVGVSNLAASVLGGIAPKVLAVMECSINGSSYNPIFLGQYEGFSWSSGSATCTIQFRDALGALQHGFSELRGEETKSVVTVGDPGREIEGYSWFKGIGSKSKLTNPFLPGETTLQMIGYSSTSSAGKFIENSAFQFGFRDDSAFIIHGADTLGFSESSGNRFCLIDPVGGDDDCLVKFRGTGRTSSHSTLNGIVTDKYFGYPDADDSTCGTDSPVTAVLPIYGNPVCELVNCFYQEGYGKSMTPGLFGRIGLAGGNDLIDWDACITTANLFRNEWRSHVDSLGQAPFRHVVTSEQKDGFGYLRKLFAKMGVFPRWRRGAYSVGYAGGMASIDHEDVPNINYSNVISMEIQPVDPSVKPIFTGLKFSNTDVDSHTVLGSTTIVSEYKPNSSPILPSMTVNTSDVAPGDPHGDDFAEWYRSMMFQRWYVFAQPSRFRVTVNNLKFARYSIGDSVTLDEWPTETKNKNGWETRLFGPSRSASKYDANIRLSGTNTANKFLIVSNLVDWVNGTVTFELLLPDGARRFRNGWYLI